MQITVTTETGNILPFDVNLELTLQDLKALLEDEVAMSASQMVLIHNMDPMNEDGRSLKDYNIQEGDVIIVSQNHTPTSTHPPSLSSQSENSAQSQSFEAMPHPQATPPEEPVDPNDPETIRRHLLSHPGELALLRERNPVLAHALESGDALVFREALENYRKRVADIDQERIRLLNADPLDPNVQAKIAQEIQQRNIQENMEAAIEYTPENFGRVVMLYIPIKVNGVEVHALVDSGAASTVMSESCAERCGIMRLVDRRFATIAIGVGTQKVIGKVHLGTVQIGTDMLTASFQVLQNQTEDMLLGLDMLRRHQCCIDLVKNVLRIGTTGTEAPFLMESELKDKDEATLAKKQKLVMEGEDAEIAKVIASSQKEQAEATPSGVQHSSSKTKEQAQSSSSHPHPISSHPHPISSYPHPISSNSSQHSSPWESSRQSSQAVVQPRPHSSHSVTGTSPSGQRYTDTAISQVMAAGFSRDQAVDALRLCGGNIELALGSLFEKTLPF